MEYDYLKISPQMVNPRDVAGERRRRTVLNGKIDGVVCLWTEWQQQGTEEASQEGHGHGGCAGQCHFCCVCSLWFSWLLGSVIEWAFTCQSQHFYICPRPAVCLETLSVSKPLIHTGGPFQPEKFNLQTIRQLWFPDFVRFMKCGLLFSYLHLWSNNQSTISDKGSRQHALKTHSLRPWLNLKYSIVKLYGVQSALICTMLPHMIHHAETES